MASSTKTLTDIERITRFRRAGYGGSVSDALRRLGSDVTLLSDQFQPLSSDMVLAGRALTVKIHTAVVDDADRLPGRDDPDHPQRRMMEAVATAEDGVILCFECGGDLHAAHFGEMSCQLARAQGGRGILIAGNCRDTRWVRQMDDFPVFCFGSRANGGGNWKIIKVGEPIFLPGHLSHHVRVNSGDFIFGDTDGVQIIPSGLVDAVLADVEHTFETENAERQKLASGMSVDEVYRVYGVL